MRQATGSDLRYMCGREIGKSLYGWIGIIARVTQYQMDCLVTMINPVTHVMVAESYPGCSDCFVLYYSTGTSQNPTEH